MNHPIDNLFDQLASTSALTAAHQRIQELQEEVDRLTEAYDYLLRRHGKVLRTLKRIEEGEL